MAATWVPAFAQRRPKKAFGTFKQNSICRRPLPRSQPASPTSPNFNRRFKQRYLMTLSDLRDEVAVSRYIASRPGGTCVQ